MPLHSTSSFAGELPIVGVGYHAQGELPACPPTRSPSTPSGWPSTTADSTKSDLDGLITCKSFGGFGHRHRDRAPGRAQSPLQRHARLRDVQLLAPPGRDGDRDRAWRPPIALLYGTNQRTAGNRFAHGGGQRCGLARTARLPQHRRAGRAWPSARHAHLYGTTEEQLGWVAVTERAHARLNPARHLPRPAHDRGLPRPALPRRAAAAGRRLHDLRRRRLPDRDVVRPRAGDAATATRVPARHGAGHRRCASTRTPTTCCGPGSPRWREPSSSAPASPRGRRRAVRAGPRRASGSCQMLELFGYCGVGRVRARSSPKGGIGLGGEHPGQHQRRPALRELHVGMAPPVRGRPPAARRVRRTARSPVPGSRSTARRRDSRRRRRRSSAPRCRRDALDPTTARSSQAAAQLLDEAAVDEEPRRRRRAAASSAATTAATSASLLRRVCPECLSHRLHLASRRRASARSGATASITAPSTRRSRRALPYNVALVELDSRPAADQQRPRRRGGTSSRVGLRVVGQPREVAPGRYLVYFRPPRRRRRRRDRRRGPHRPRRRGRRCASPSTTCRRRRRRTTTEALDPRPPRLLRGRQPDAEGSQARGRLGARAERPARDAVDHRDLAAARRRRSPRSANGTAAHALDFDDVSMRMIHPSVNLVPALLAVGESRHLSAAGQLLEGYLAGFEVQARVCAASSTRSTTTGAGTAPAPSDRSARPWPPAGRSGSTRSRAATRSGSPRRRLGSIRKNFGSMVKPLHAGQAAFHGLQAADLAEPGLHGETARSSRDRTGSSRSSRCPSDPGASTRPSATGAPYELVESGIALKRFACCGAIHSAQDAAPRAACEAEPFAPERRRAHRVPRQPAGARTSSSTT